MSEIRATTISDLVGTGPVNLTGQSAAKAWSNLNGTGTIAANDDFNMSSYTDNGTGDYSINFSADFASANYQVATCASQTTATSTLTTVSINSTNPPVAGTLRVYANYVNATYDRTQADEPYVNVVCMGDLA